MVDKALGLILRTRPLTETSLIVHWLTANSGRVATVAKGARRPKSSFQGKLDLFYLAEFSYQRSRTSELHTLREVGVRVTHSFLRENLGYLQQAAYCVQLIEQATETETPLPSIFNLFCGLLSHLAAHPPQSQTIFAFELKLLDELGLRPELSETRLSPGTRALVTRLQQDDWSRISGLRLSPTQELELKAFLQKFLVFNLGRLPAGRDCALP